MQEGKQSPRVVARLCFPFAQRLMEEGHAHTFRVGDTVEYFHQPTLTHH